MFPHSPAPLIHTDYRLLLLIKRKVLVPLVPTKLFLWMELLVVTSVLLLAEIGVTFFNHARRICVFLTRWVEMDILSS